MNDQTDLADIPSDMDNDPNADEQTIDQQRGDTVPANHTEQHPDDEHLANSIALAIDGSGIGLLGSTPGRVAAEDTDDETPDDETVR